MVVAKADHAALTDQRQYSVVNILQGKLSVFLSPTPLPPEVPQEQYSERFPSPASSVWYTLHCCPFSLENQSLALPSPRLLKWWPSPQVGQCVLGTAHITAGAGTLALTFHRSLVSWGWS